MASEEKHRLTLELDSEARNPEFTRWLMSVFPSFGTFNPPPEEHIKELRLYAVDTSKEGETTATFTTSRTLTAQTWNELIDQAIEELKKLKEPT